MSIKDEIDAIAKMTALRTAEDRINAASGVDPSAMTTALRTAEDRITASSVDLNAMTTALVTARDRVNSDFVLDRSSIRSQIDLAISIGSHDPLSAVTDAVKTGSTIGSLLDSSHLTLGTRAIGGINLHDTISALGELRRPYDQLANVSNFAPYVGSITNLASVSGIASSIEHLSSLNSGNVLPSISGERVASVIGMEPSGLLPNTIIAGGSGLELNSLISSLPVTTLTGVLAGTTLASTRALLGVERAYAELVYPDRLSSPIASAIQMPSYVTTLHEGLISLTAAAKSSWDNISLSPGILEGMSLFNARSPAIEIYSASQAAAVISLPASEFPPVDAEIEGIINDTVDEFEERLSSLAPALVEVYRGGTAVLEIGGPDWRRQTMVSFRELTTHVMHILAPDAKVQPWAKPEHFDKGKLTRKARLEYIFEPVASGELVGFVKADLKASIELFDLLNNGTHRLSSKATAAQLRYLRARVVNFVTSMLEARGH